MHAVSKPNGNSLLHRGRRRDRTDRTGERYAIRPGAGYALNDHDERILRAVTDLRLVCVFTPALVGPEKHNEKNSYPLMDDDGGVLKR